MVTVLVLVENICLVEHGVLRIVRSGDTGHTGSGGLAGQVVGRQAVVSGNLRQRLLRNRAREALGSGLTLGLAGGDGACLATALDTLIAVLIMLVEVLKKFLVLLGNITLSGEPGKHGNESLDGVLVEIVLMRLHVSELGEGFIAVIELADKRLHTLVSLLVGADVATLSKGLPAETAGEGLLASVAAHVRLEVASLRECEATVLPGADVGLGAGVGAAVDVQMSLLYEAFVAHGPIANPFLLGLVLSRCGGASGSRRLSVVGTRGVSRSWPLGSLHVGLGLFFLDSLHELVDFGLEVDSVSRVDGFVVRNRLGVGDRVRGNGRAAVGCQRLAASGRRRNLHLVERLGVALKDHAALIKLGQLTLLIFIVKRRANRRSWRRAVIWHILESGRSLILRGSKRWRRLLRVVSRANDIMSHVALRLLVLHLRSRRAARVVRQVALTVHHIEVVGHVLRPATPVGMRGRLSSESHCMRVVDDAHRSTTKYVDIQERPRGKQGKASRQ